MKKTTEKNIEDRGGLDKLRKVDIKDITNAKLPICESMSSMLQTHRASLNPFYLKGID